MRGPSGWGAVGSGMNSARGGEKTLADARSFAGNVSQVLWETGDRPLDPLGCWQIKMGGYDTSMNENKEATKAVRGPGGIKCSCCRASKTVKEARTLHNRILRHRMKAALIGAGREEA